MIFFQKIEKNGLQRDKYTKLGKEIIINDKLFTLREGYPIVICHKFDSAFDYVIFKLD